MNPISLFNAKTHLSQLVEQIATGAADEIVIARHGQPVARLVPVPKQNTDHRIGIATGEFEVPDDIDRHNSDVAQLFLES